MATVIGQCSLQPIRLAKKEGVLLYLHFTVDTSGAVVTANTVSADPGLSVVKNGTGNYDLTIPKCPSDALMWVQPHFTGTFPTAGQFVRVSAKNLLSGTASILTSTTYGGAAADLNQAVEFDVFVLGSMGK